MFETLIAVAIVVMLLAAALIPPMTLMWMGVAIGTIGAVVGLIAGFVYHAQLWRALRLEGFGTKGIWLRPHHLHSKLSNERRRPVQQWFWIGAASFGLTMLGSTAVITAIVRLLGAQ